MVTIIGIFYRYYIIRSESTVGREEGEYNSSEDGRQKLHTAANLNMSPSSFTEVEIALPT